MNRNTEMLTLQIIRGKNDIYSRSLKVLGVVVLCSFLYQILSFGFGFPSESIYILTRYLFALSLLVLVFAIKLKPPMDFSTEMQIDERGINYSHENLRLDEEDIDFVKIFYKSYNGEKKYALTQQYSQSGWNNSIQVKTKEGRYYQYSFYVESAPQANEVFKFAKQSEFVQIVK